jgi:hypothetical protein
VLLVPIPGLDRPGQPESHMEPGRCPGC